MYGLDGRRALVTGGAAGIGRAIAVRLAREGCDVAILDRDEAGATVEEVRAAGRLAASARGDVGEEHEVRIAVGNLERELGRLDILVNNAGTNVRKRPEEYSMADWRFIIETNLTSAFCCSHAAYQPMCKAGAGKIINIGSMMSIFGAPFVPAYAASKGGIVQFSKVCANAWANDNIQVNAVLPGWIDTELTRRARAQIAGLNERVLARTPAGRWGVPDDLAGIAVFLCSAASDFVTGTAIPVDGGYAING